VIGGGERAAEAEDVVAVATADRVVAALPEREIVVTRIAVDRVVAMRAANRNCRIPQILRNAGIRTATASLASMSQSYFPSSVTEESAARHRRSPR
jgi:hypothetical protein